MRIIIISKEANSTDMALRLAMEGHKVRFALPEDEKGEFEHHAEGLIHKVKDWESYARKSDLIIFDDSNLPAEMHKAKLISHETGVPIFGCCMTSEDIEFAGKKFRGHEAPGMLESKRGWVHRLLRECGCGAEFESISFDDPSKAIAHLKEHKVPHAIKPEMEGSGESFSYISRRPDGSDAIDFLQTLPQRPGARKINSIEIEEKVSGVESGVSVWFNGKEAMGPILVNFEHKKTHSDGTGRGMGVNCGEQGTTCFADQRPIMRVKLFTETLARFIPILELLDYRGAIDFNCIVNEKGAHVLELTPRLGYPLSYIQAELQITPWGELLHAVASGKAITNKVKAGWAMGVVLCGEEYPNWDAGHKKCLGLPIYGVTGENVKSFFHPYDVKIEDKRTVLTGCYIGCVTASGKSISDCRNQIYEFRIPRIDYAGKWFRHDIGLKTDEDISTLKSLGYEFQIEAPIESRLYRLRSRKSLA